MGESEWEDIASPISVGSEYQTGVEGLEASAYNQAIQGTALEGLFPMHPELQPQQMSQYAYLPFTYQSGASQLHQPQVSISFFRSLN